MSECLKNNPDLAPKGFSDKMMEKISGKFEKTCVASVTTQGKDILSANISQAGMIPEEAEGRMSYLKSHQAAQEKKTLLSGLTSIRANTEDAGLQKNIDRIVASIK